MAARKRRNRILTPIAAAVVCLLIAIAATWGLIARAAVGALASSMTKTQVTIGSAHIGPSGASFGSIDVRSTRGEPIANIDRLRLTYSVPDWIAGRRLFGLSSIDADGAQITIIRHKDGSYNIPVPSQQQPAGPSSPIRLNGHVAGTATLIDDGGPRTIASRAALATAFTFDATARSSYRARLDYLTGGHQYHITGAGAFDKRSDMQQWSVPPMPIDNLLNMFVPAGVRVARGYIDGAAVRIIGIPAPNGALRTAVIASTILRSLQFSVPGLRTPVRNIGGRLDISSAAAMFEGLHGSLAGVPLRGGGGIYDFTDPQLHLSIAADGDAAQLRKAVAQTQRLPAKGQLQIRILAEGSATQPLAMISVRSPSLSYAPVHITNAALLAAYHDRNLDVLSAHAGYRNAIADAQGAIALQQQPNALEIIAHGNAPADVIPYAPAFAGTPIDATVLASSSDLRRIDAYGTIAGSNATRQLAGTFAVASNGTGSIGPVVVNGKGGDLFAQAMLDQPHKVDTAFVHANGFFVPVLGGTVSGDGALLFNGRSAVAQLNDLRGANVHVGGVPVRRASATVAVAPKSVRVYAADVATGTDDILASTVHSNGELAIAANAIPVLHGSVSLAALAGTAIANPEMHAATVVARGVRYNGISATGVSSLRYANGTLAVRNTNADIAHAYVTVGGTVGGLAFGEPILPHYDLNVATRAAEVSPFVALAAPAQKRIIDASVDASVHVTGFGTDPSLRGSIDVPEGRLNGLAFRDLQGTIAGTRSGMSVSAGSVIVGTTRVSFDGSAGTNRDVTGRVAAPHADLTDFDDFFDAGDVLSGRGSLAATVALGGGRFASSGTVNIAGLRFRQFNLGDAIATWREAPGGIAIRAQATGKRGNLAAHGTIDPLTRSGNVVATAQRLDLNSWLPLFGMQAPIQGFVDAQADVKGRFPDVDGTIAASVNHGLVGRIPLQRATIAMQTSGGMGRINALTIQVPTAVVTGSGTFGLYATDPLALDVRGRIADVGAFGHVATGHAYDITGSLDTNAHIGGTLLAPHIHDASTLNGFRFRNVSVPAVATNVDVSPKLARLGARATLQTGSITFAGTAQLNGRFMPQRNAPIQGTLTATDAALSNIANMLPKGTAIGGRVDGTVRAYGTLHDPQLRGALTADNLNYSSPQERTPITGGGQLTFAGRTIALRNTAANVGSGTVRVSGTAYVPAFGDPGAAAFNLNVVASGATIDAPQYYKGRIDGNVHVIGALPKSIALGGNVTASSARIPLTAIYNPNSSGESKPLPFSLAFNQLRFGIGNDVRLQSSNVDVGARGNLDLAGTLSAPRASGSFVATGGTVSFYRTFTVDRARIAFDPSEGIVPRINARATTYITDPDTMIGIHVTGPATMMDLGLESDPNYSRAQILGLLAGAQEFGAVQGVNTTNGRVQSTPGSLLGGMAEGQVNQVFTRNLLEPLSSAVAGTLGLKDVQLTNVVGQGFGATAGKAFGRHLSAIFSESFGYPKRSSFALEAKPNIGTALRATVYTISGQTLFPLSQPPAAANATVNDDAGLASLMSMQMESGSGGIDFSYVRKFP